MSDSYPQHLNPFEGKKKTGLGISHSFKELKRTLRRSFRGKKREENDVTIRQKPVETPRPSVTSYSNPNPEIALPRSRFHERLSLRPAYGANPFDENEENTYSKMVAARRKVKKRAPVPPHSHSSQDVNGENLGIPSSESHWSLTSGDTDYTYSVGNMSRGDSENELDSSAILEHLKDFNEDMQKLKDDSNNNSIIKEEESAKETCTIPDLVISCPSDSESIKFIDKEEEEEEIVATTTIVVEDTKVSISKDDNQNIVNQKEKGIENENTKEDTPSKDITVKTENNQNSNQVTENENTNGDTTDDGLTFHERKSLYIAGSRDNLEESSTCTGRVSLYITGSSDNLDASNNNESDSDKMSDNDDKVDGTTPIPKQRKNKLSKNVLLGI